MNVVVGAQKMAESVSLPLGSAPQKILLVTLSLVRTLVCRNRTAQLVLILLAVVGVGIMACVVVGPLSAPLTLTRVPNAPSRLLGRQCARYHLDLMFQTGMVILSLLGSTTAWQQPC